MQRNFKLDKTFMNKVEKPSNCIFRSGRLSLPYFEYVDTLFWSLLRQNTKNQQIKSAKYTVLMLCVHQNERKKAFDRSLLYQQLCAAMMFGCSPVIAHSLVRRFEQTGISINAQDQSDG